MGLELRFAWRNVWRNPRRSALTIAATVFAVVLVLFFVAMAAGQHEQMIEDAVRLASGHVAISGAGYRESQTLEHYVTLDPRLERAVENTPGVRGWAPRLVGFALASKDGATRGVAVLGVDPAREPQVSMLPERVTRGQFVSPRLPHGIVLGADLARALGAGLGDEVLLYSVAYSLEGAYDLFRVVGIVDVPDTELERRLVLVSLADAQAFYVYGDRVSELAVLADDAGAAPALAHRLLERLSALDGQRLEVRTWEQLMPDLAQLILLDDAGMYLLLVILVVVVAFGILNTILMSVLERRRELGVLLALGLRPASIFRIVYLESLLLAAIGLAIGMAIGIALVLWFQAHPVPLEGRAAQATELFGFQPLLVWKLKPWNPIGSALTILGVAVAAALYPAIRASRGRPVDALRSL
jgi:putative ABC transport system permease protein